MSLNHLLNLLLNKEKVLGKIKFSQTDRIDSHIYLINNNRYHVLITRKGKTYSGGYHKRLDVARQARDNLLESLNNLNKL